MTFQTVACAACLMMCIITIFNTSEAEAIKEGEHGREKPKEIAFALLMFLGEFCFSKLFVMASC